eukprot:8512857-Pyramimonas_sp.AAC.1
MLGDRRDSTDTAEMCHPGCPVKLKGHESGVVLLYACDVLGRHGQRVPYFTELSRVGAALTDYLELLRTSP